MPVKTGKRVRDIEFEYSVYNGNIVLNMANYSYDEEPKKVKIFVDGKFSHLNVLD